jgi:hypothetical protein
LFAYGVSLREDLHDLPRSCIGGNVVIGGFAAEKKIANASSGEVSLVPACAQRADDFGGELFGVWQGKPRWTGARRYSIRNATRTFSATTLVVFSESVAEIPNPEIWMHLHAESRASESREIVT